MGNTGSTKVTSLKYLSKIRRLRLAYAIASALCCQALPSLVHAQERLHARYAGSVMPNELRVAGLIDPVGVDQSSPNFSWRLKASAPQAHDLRQTMYRVLVASSVEKLSQDKGDLWDSRRVRSARELSIPLRRTTARLASKLFLEGARMGSGGEGLRLERSGTLDERHPASRRVDSTLDCRSAGRFAGFGRAANAACNRATSPTLPQRLPRKRSGQECCGFSLRAWAI